MQIRRLSPIVPAILVAFLAAACGGGAGATSGAGSPAGASAAPAGGSDQPAATPAPGGSGAVDCAKIKTAAVQLLGVQLLAQLRSPDAAEQLKTKQIGNLDLDAFLAAMQDLHALDGHSSALGDPKAAIDAYEDAAKDAQAMFATEPITQASVDAYVAKIGTISDFLGHQIAISGAMDAAGC